MILQGCKGIITNKLTGNIIWRPVILQGCKGHGLGKSILKFICKTAGSMVYFEV